MPEYQYETVVLPIRLRSERQQNEINDTINTYAKNGWRLVTISADGYMGRVIIAFEKKSDI